VFNRAPDPVVYCAYVESPMTAARLNVGMKVQMVAGEPRHRVVGLP
jgi:hypothetical protein